MQKSKFSYLVGHNIDGRMLFPASGYIEIIWNTFAKLNNSNLFDTPVQLENLVFHRATLLAQNASVQFSIKILDATGKFEIRKGKSLTVSGVIKSLELPLNINNNKKCEFENVVTLNTNDFYKDLRLRGYLYSKMFCGITKSDQEGLNAIIKWNNNWVTFIDAMFQVKVFGMNTRLLHVPNRIKKIIIDPERHSNIINKSQDDTIAALADKELNIIQCGGVEVFGLKTASLQRKNTKENRLVLETYKFIPYENWMVDEVNAIEILIQIVLENLNLVKLKVADILICNNEGLNQSIKYFVEKEPNLSCDLTIVHQFQENCIQNGCEARLHDITRGKLIGDFHLICGYSILQQPRNVLANMMESIQMSGFILLEEELNVCNQDTIQQLLKSYNLTLISAQKSKGKILILLKRFTDLSSKNKRFIIATQKSYAWIENLKEALQVADHYVYILCQGEQYFGGVGITRCILKEKIGQCIRLIYIQDENVDSFSVDNKLYSTQLEKDLVINIFKNGKWGSFRNCSINSSIENYMHPSEVVFVNALVKGDLSSLRWIEKNPYEMLLEKDLEQCTVCYASLNFRDIMLATGKLSIDALPGDLPKQECVLGIEFSGFDSKGRRVMATTQGKTLATHCLADKNFLIEIPSNWSFEEAATVPTVYSTVYFALVLRANMKKGESILIHSGTGGIGQAAISVALHHGLIVYTTVGSTKKREYLKERFPKLTDDYIFDSHSLKFERDIMRITNGKGVHIVLNSLSDEKLLASVRCVGINGRFLEIGKADLSNDASLGMEVFLKGITFHGILYDNVTLEEFKEIKKLLLQGIENGAVQPLPVNVFEKNQIEDAFRFMASGMHMGKVLIKVRDTERLGKEKINAMPRVYMNPLKSYIITGGLGGFGLELAQWLAIKGARYLILTSRSGFKTGYQTLVVNRLRKAGVNVIIDSHSDMTTEKGAQKLLQNSNKIAPVGGIFNLATTLCDKVLQNIDENDFKIVCSAKVDGTFYLDKFTRKMCPLLDHFVCFSSVTSSRGNVGQTNYGFANSAMERICEKRKKEGFPALAIQWGAIGDVGLIVETFGAEDVIVSGTSTQNISSCLEVLDWLMKHPDCILTSYMPGGATKITESKKDSATEAISKLIGIKNVKNISLSTPLSNIGMDSLLATEVQQVLERRFDVILNISDVKNLTFDDLNKIK